MGTRWQRWIVVQANVWRTQEYRVYFKFSNGTDAPKGALAACR